MYLCVWVQDGYSEDAHHAGDILACTLVCSVCRPVGSLVVSPALRPVCSPIPLAVSSSVRSCVFIIILAAATLQLASLLQDRILDLHNKSMSV